jgi:hypothetical protein
MRLLCQYARVGGTSKRGGVDRVLTSRPAPCGFAQQSNNPTIQRLFGSVGVHVLRPVWRDQDINLVSSFRWNLDSIDDDTVRPTQRPTMVHEKLVLQYSTIFRSHCTRRRASLCTWYAYSALQ